MLVKTSVLVTDSVQNIASSKAGAATEVRLKLNIRSSTYAGHDDGGAVDGDEQVARLRERQIAEGRHDQRAAGRIQVMRVDVVEMLVVDVPAVPEVRHRAVDRLEVVGDVAVRGEHDGAVNDRHDGHRPQHRTQYGRSARCGGAGCKRGLRPAAQTATRGFNCRHERTVHGRLPEGSGGTVGVGGGQLAAVEVADQRGDRA